MRRRPPGIRRAFHHQRRHGTDEHELRDPALAVTGDVTRGFASAGRVANVDRISQIEMFHHRGGVRCVMVHIVPVADLARPTMTATVVSDNSETVIQEKEKL